MDKKEEGREKQRRKGGIENLEKLTRVEIEGGKMNGRGVRGRGKRVGKEGKKEV